MKSASYSIVWEPRKIHHQPLCLVIVETQLCEWKSAWSANKHNKPHPVRLTDVVRIDDTANRPWSACMLDRPGDHGATGAATGFYAWSSFGIWCRLGQTRRVRLAYEAMCCFPVDLTSPTSYMQHLTVSSTVSLAIVLLYEIFKGLAANPASDPGTAANLRVILLHVYSCRWQLVLS